MKKDTLTKNFIFQLAYQAIVLIIPLVISPYLTRVLGDVTLGNYTYINSIAYYFVIFAMLGISRHGQRIISQNINDNIKLRKSFWSLLTVHFFISSFVLLIYCFAILFFGKNDFQLYLIEGIYVASAIFDITWFYYGLENFKSVVLKNALIKILECVLIFLLVKSREHIWLYALITASGILLGHVVLLPNAFKIAKPIRFEMCDMKMHVKPLIVFFVAVLASSLYTVFDKTLLGILTPKENVAYYEYANKIVNIPKVVIAVIGTVMFPRACKMASNGNIDGQKKYIHFSVLLTSLISMASIFGLFAIAENFSIIYFGREFSECGKVMIFLSPIIYIVGLGDVLRTQYMIPNNMDKQFTFSIVLNAIVNLILSFILIPVLGVYGAVVGTVSAELFGLLFQLFLCRKFINFEDIFRNLLSSLTLGLFMFGFVSKVKAFDDGPFSLLLQILVGVITFGTAAAAYIFFFEKEFFYKIKNRLFSKK